LSFVHRSGLGPRVSAALAAAVLLLALIVGSATASESHGALRDSYVAPRLGTPATVIRFSVTFQGHGDRSDARVDVVIDGAAHAMAPAVDVPLLGFLRDTQNYVHLAAHGLTLWDVASTRFQGDREQWEPIVTWVN